jgi:hypothetical protein
MGPKFAVMSCGNNFLQYLPQWWLLSEYSSLRRPWIRYRWGLLCWQWVFLVTPSLISYKRGSICFCQPRTDCYEPSKCLYRCLDITPFCVDNTLALWNTANNFSAASKERLDSFLDPVLRTMRSLPPPSQQVLWVAPLVQQRLYRRSPPSLISN